MRRIGIILTLSIIIIGSACQKKTTSIPESNKDETQTVIAEKIVQRDLDGYVKVIGKLEGLTDISMSSETNGRIKALYVKLGDSIKQGQKIGEVDNDILKIRLDQAIAAEQSAESAMANADLAMKAGEALYKTNSISLAERNQNLAAFRGAKAGLDGAHANVEAAQKAIDNSELKAAATGVIANLPIKVGEYLNPGQLIATIIDPSTLLIKTGVGESRILDIKKGLPVSITYPGLSKALTGSVRAYGIKPLPGSANYPLEITIPNPGRQLMPGMVVTAKIRTKTYHDVLYIPINFVVKEFDRDYLYVVNAKSEAEKREVKLGELIDTNVMITQGIQAGDMVIIGGIENLEPGMKVKVKN